MGIKVMQGPSANKCMSPNCSERALVLSLYCARHRPNLGAGMKMITGYQMAQMVAMSDRLEAAFKKHRGSPRTEARHVLREASMLLDEIAK